jgi:hypothetical protein
MLAGAAYAVPDVAVSAGSPYEVGVVQRPTLTEQQLVILRWIADGCPDGAMDGSSHRISAAALRNRGLVRISGRGNSWSAAVTAPGQEYLAKVDGPDAPLPRQGNVSVTQQLVDDVIAAGGALRVPQKRWNDPTSVDYASRAGLAERHRKVPDGKRLTVIRDGDELVIRLVDAPELVAASILVSITVPVCITRYHEAAREFRDRRERHEVSKELLGRATRIIHVMAIEAVRRGWSAAPPAASKNGYGRLSWTGGKDGHLELNANGHAFWLRLLEEGVHSRGSWEEETARYRNVSRASLLYRERELPSGPYDASATGRLRLELMCSNYWLFSGRQSRWADRRSWTLEERLPHVFREIEERLVHAARDAEEKRLAAEARAEEARSEAADRERQWHVLMDRAREQLARAHNAKHLRSQADRWREATALRLYCDAAESAHGQHNATAEWLAWAREYAAHLDPLSTPPVAPLPAETTVAALQDYLPAGWSAEGPDLVPQSQRRWR